MITPAPIPHVNSEAVTEIAVAPYSPASGGKEIKAARPQGAYHPPVQDLTDSQFTPHERGDS